MNEILVPPMGIATDSIPDKIRIASLKFKLEYKSNKINNQLLYEFLLDRTKSKDPFIYIGCLGEVTIALINLEKQPNWTRTDKFIFNGVIPSTTTIKGSFSDEVEYIKKYCTLYPSNIQMRICSKCNENKEKFNFTPDKIYCKKCDMVSGDIIAKTKDVNMQQKIVDQEKYINTLFELMATKYNDRIIALENEVINLRKINERYLNLISDMHGIHTMEIKPIEYESGFILVCLGSPFILANLKNEDVLIEFIPQNKDEIVDNTFGIGGAKNKCIIYFGYHKNLNEQIKMLEDIYVAKNSYNKDFKIISRVNTPIDIGESIMNALVSKFIDSLEIRDNFSIVKSLRDEVKSENVRICNKSMLNILKVFISNKLH